MQWDIVQLFQIHELLKCGKIKKSIMNYKSHSGLVRFKSGNFFFDYLGEHFPNSEDDKVTSFKSIL